MIIGIDPVEKARINVVLCELYSVMNICILTSLNSNIIQAIKPCL